MKVDLWTLTTGKILRSGYLDNGCHGSKKYVLMGSKVPFMVLNAHMETPVGQRYLLPWQPTCSHGNTNKRLFLQPEKSDRKVQEMVREHLGLLVSMATILLPCLPKRLVLK